MELFQQIFDRYGLPMGILCVLIYFLWRLSGWVRIKVAEPIVDSFLEYLKVSSETMKSQDKQIAEIGTSIKLKAEAIKILAESSERQEKQGERIERAVIDQTRILTKSIERQTRVIREEKYANDEDQARGTNGAG